MILTFMYSTIIVSSKRVLSINLFLSMFFKDCLTIISIFQGLGWDPVTYHCPELLQQLAALYSDANYINHMYYYDLFNRVSSSLYLNEYLSIFIYFIITILLSYVILSFSYILAVQKPETEKMSVYECGFEPYEDARQKFDVHFYLIAILFILFDIEAMFLIPWCVSLPFINYVGYLIMMEFILELCLGFLYVWYLGGLDW
jgi:NADH:ubiquinone oxidoreductase subunit 3 (subunit A)